MRNTTHRRPLAVAAARRAPSATAVLLAGALSVLLALFASGARAQEAFPRIGLSASSEAYVDSIHVRFGESFTLYAMAFGHEPGDPLDQAVTSLPWVIHQVCCGAVLDILDMQLNPALTHEGHPLAGMVTSSDTCLQQDAIWLATMQVAVVSNVPGDYLWAAGPYGPIRDCDGAEPFFMAMPVTIRLNADPTPTAEDSWGSLKALYR